VRAGLPGSRGGGGVERCEGGEFVRSGICWRGHRGVEGPLRAGCRVEDGQL
jgi:hypothetical protein